MTAGSPIHAEAQRGCAIPIHMNRTTKNTPNTYGSLPPATFPAAISASAIGTRQSDAHRGHRSHGASHAKAPTNSATTPTISVAPRSKSLGPGRGIVTTSTMPEPRKSTAARRPSVFAVRGEATVPTRVAVAGERRSWSIGTMDLPPGTPYPAQVPVNRIRTCAARVGTDPASAASRGALVPQAGCTSIGPTERTREGEGDHEAANDLRDGDDGGAHGGPGVPPRRRLERCGRARRVHDHRHRGERPDQRH